MNSYNANHSITNTVEYLKIILVQPYPDHPGLVTDWLSGWVGATPSFCTNTEVTDLTIRTQEHGGVTMILVY